jgi:hypothetical protein
MSGYNTGSVTIAFAGPKVDVDYHKIYSISCAFVTVYFDVHGVQTRAFFAVYSCCMCPAVGPSNMSKTKRTRAPDYSEEEKRVITHSLVL